MDKSPARQETMRVMHQRQRKTTEETTVTVSERQAVKNENVREINFPQGGRLLLTLDANIMLLDPVDRQFVMQVCKLLDHYENGQLAAVCPINKTEASEHALMMINDLAGPAEQFELANVWLGRPIAAEKPKE